MIYPERLQKGDTIGIIAPAGPPQEKDLQKAIPFFRKLGLHVKLGKHIAATHGYLAGHDAERLADFHDMIGDPDIKAIIFARGGYGTGRIAPSVDYDLIRKNPKVIWGYSDITYLHTAVRQATGLVTFHGSMAASDVGKGDFAALSGDLFKQLFEPMKLYYSEEISPLKVYATGEATGQLIGGNLSLLISTIGTPYEIDTTGKLLLLEDIGEEPYKVDAMLNQLTLSGKLADAAGIVVGDFAHAKPRNEKQSLSLEQVFHDYFDSLSCPVISGFKIGHCQPHFAVPLGVEATLSTTKRSLEVESGVR